MCYSQADGGKRCFTHTTLESANKLQEQMDKAHRQGNKRKYLELRKEYFTTERGIHELESEGKRDLAKKFVARHNQLVDRYNRRYGGTKKHVEDYETRMARLEKEAQAKKEAEQRKAELAEAKRLEKANAMAASAAKKAGKLKPVKPGESVWTKGGTHRETGTKFSPKGWSKDGINEATGTKFDETGHDAGGYNEAGFHKDTNLDRQGFAPDGYDIHGRDRQGLDREGYDRLRLDKFGWTREGWNFTATIHRDTGTNLDPQGFDGRDWSPALGMFREEAEARGLIPMPAKTAA